MIPDLPLPIYRNQLTDRAKKIGQMIRTDIEPVLIPYHLTEGAIVGECFQNVRDHVQQHGGEVVDGWVIWESPPFQVEAEFHSVWRDTHGELVDITPPLHRGKKTTFLPAVSGQSYEGRNIHAVLMSYEDNDRAREWIRLSQRYQDLVYPEGEIQTDSFVMTKEIMEIIMKKAVLIGVPDKK